VQKLEIDHFPSVNDTLNTVVSRVHKVMNVDVVRGVIYNQGQIAARCEMKLYLKT
jgi:hypothetical protein